MKQLYTPKSFKTVEDEIYNIYNIQILLKEIFAAKIIQDDQNAYPYIMLINLQEKHIKNIINLF